MIDGSHALAGHRRRSRLTSATIAVVLAAVAIVWVGGPAVAGPTLDPTVPAASPTSSTSSEIPGLGAAGGVLNRITEVAVGGVGDGAVTMLLKPIATSLLDGLEGVIDELAAFVDTTTNPDPMDASLLGPDGPYQTVAAFAAALLVGFICLGVAYGLMTGAPGQVLIRLLRDVPLVVLAITGFPWVVGQLVELSNALSSAVLPAGDTAKELLTTQLLETLRGMASQNVVPSVLIGFLTFAATVLVYLELVVRVILLRLVEALAPLSLAPMVWAPARDAGRKVAELTVAVVLSQPVIFLALRIGLDFLHDHATSSPTDLGAWGRLLLGLGVVVVATFSPWVIWRLVPHAEAMVVAQGLSRSPGRAAMSVMQTAYWVTALRAAAGGRHRTPALSPASASGAGLGPPRSLPFPRPSLSNRSGPSPGSSAGGGRPAPAGPGSPGGSAGSGAPSSPGPAGRNPASGSTTPSPARPSTARGTPPPTGPAAGPGSGPSTKSPGSPRSAPSPVRGSNGGVAPGWSRRRPST